MSSMMRARVVNVLKEIASSSSRCCPAHAAGGSYRVVNTTPAIDDSKDYAMEMACSNIRYGPGVTREIGMDIKNLGSKRVCLFTDENVARLSPVKVTLDSLMRHNNNKVQVDVYDKVRVEPTDSSVQQAVDFVLGKNYDMFVAVGGGSVIDTCKIANLIASAPEGEQDVMNYVNAPLGKGKPVNFKLNPLIAIPTTSGTGSETTGTAVFDYEPNKAKTGISDRSLRPLLGIIDPLHTKFMPERLAANSGFDVLCHALESYTALPYTERQPCPKNPSERPVYQGSNPISDVWSLQALRVIAKYFKRSVYNADDDKARAEMHMASTFAGVGFGNSGCHLCHAMSYPISGNVRDYKAEDYRISHSLVPHGLSVMVTSPAVFEFTAPLCPERHIEVAEILGADTTNVHRIDAGLLLADQLRKICLDMKVENGLTALGYTTSDLSALARGTMPQKRLLNVAPKQVVSEEIESLLEKSMTII